MYFWEVLKLNGMKKYEKDLSVLIEKYYTCTDRMNVGKNDKGLLIYILI